MTLTSRYVHATTRRVPEAKRAEIGAELTASIEDMVEARVAAGEDPAEAERAVLAELGDPAQLAWQYADRSLYLIGPDYFLTWWRLLLLLIAIVPTVVGAIVALVALSDGGDVGDVIGEFVGAWFGVAFQVAFWVTLTFALLDRFGVPNPGPFWSVDDLPEPRERQVGLSDTAASIAFSLIVATFLPFQHFRSWIEGDDGDDIPILNPDLWSFWLPFLIATLLLGAVYALVVYRVGRVTPLLAASNAAIGLAFAIPVIWLLTQERLLNPELVAQFSQFAENLDTVTTVLIVAVVAVTVWDLVESAWKAWTADRDTTTTPAP